MTDYAVHYRVERPEKLSRVELLVRVVAFIALGVVGLSFGTIFVFAYLALPVYATVRLSHRTASEYLDADGPRVVRALHWLAAISAWAFLASDRLPTRSPEETVELVVPRIAHPSAKSAALRVLTGIPSALVLGLLGFIGGFVWLWAAIEILIAERIGHLTWEYLVGLQRWSVRLLAYQASLVDEYPPFAFAETAHAQLPRATGTTPR